MSISGSGPKVSDEEYDAIIIGAGHNGLVAAGYLARAGKKVLVLERREIPGGTLVTEDLGGWQADMVQSGALRPDIVKRLGLSLPAPLDDSAFISLLPDGERLVLAPQVDRAVESIKRVGPRTRVGALRDRVANRRGANIGAVAAARQQVEYVFYALRDGHVRALQPRGAA